MAAHPAISSARTHHRLIYCSRVAPSWTERIEGEVDDIVAVSVRNNTKAGLTGLLLLHETWFVQALEGPAERVMTTYGRILNDPRHESGQVLTSGPATERLFGAWAMCARRIGPTDQAVIETLEHKGVFEPSKLTGPHALKLLQAVAGVKARQAA